VVNGEGVVEVRIVVILDHFRAPWVMRDCEGDEGCESFQGDESDEGNERNVGCEGFWVTILPASSNSSVRGFFKKRAQT